MTDRRRISLAAFTFCTTGLLIFGPFLSLSQAQDLPPEVLRYAHMVLYNGRVLTMDRDQPPINVAQAIALRDGRVLAVGDDDRILKMAGPDTVKVDLDGKTIIPGVVDTHSHPNTYALRHYSREVAPAYLKYLRDNHVRLVTIRWDTKENALDDFKRVAESVPPGEWLYTTSMLNTTVLEELKREDLDQVVPNNPVYVMIGNAMRGLANSQMLDIIQEKYGDRLPGVLKDEQGVPTGLLFGAGATVIDQELIPKMPPKILAPIFKKELEEWVALGITTLSTRLSGFEVSAYAHLDREGELPLRLAYSSEIGRGNPFLERDLKRFGNLQGHGTDGMWLIGITVGIPDGSGPPRLNSATNMWSGSTCTSVPKRERLPNDFSYPEGLCFWDLPDDPGADAILVANRYGYRIAGVHTFGDKGYLMMLDAFNKANQEDSILGRRFALDHGTLVSPEVLEQAAQLDVTWSIQPLGLYGGSGGSISRVFGEEIAHRWLNPVKSMIDAGMRVTYGADTHSDPQRHPMFGLEVLVTRKGRDGRVFGPRERIDRASGLLMLTRWGADYVLREEELGSLEVGKLADLVLLDSNPLDRDIPDEDLSEIKVLATIIGGKVVYGSLN